MNALVFLFLAWIAAETGLELPTPPSVVLVAAEEMRERSVRPGNRVEALYERATATVYLPESWNSEALYDRAMLLHELVHHVQEYNQVASQCNAEREQQAYELTRIWLGEQGVADPYSFLKVDELTVAILSLCLSENRVM